MKYHWEELLDEFQEKDLDTFFPDTFLEVDELTQKRIEQRTLQTIKNQKRVMKKNIVAIICLLLITGIAAKKPIGGMIERFFHYLPNIGIYETDKKADVYAAQILDGSFTEQDIEVVLKNVYAENQTLYMEIEFEGDLYDFQTEEFYIILYSDTTETKCFPNKERIYREHTDTASTLTKYNTSFEIHISEMSNCYTVELQGFTNTLSFCLIEDVPTTQPLNIGVHQTKNNITVTTAANVTEEGIELEYYIHAKETIVQPLQYQSFSMASLPYGYTRLEDIPKSVIEQQWYVTNKYGDRVSIQNQTTLLQGTKYLLEGDKTDFPLVVHQAPLTGIGTETYTLSIPKYSQMHQTLEFPYGVLQIETVEIQQNDDGTNEFLLTYHIEPKNEKRQMYFVCMNIQESITQTIIVDEIETFTYHVQATIPDTIKEYTLDIYNPYYWIIDDYALVIDESIEH